MPEIMRGDFYLIILCETANSRPVTKAYNRFSFSGNYVYFKEGVCSLEAEFVLRSHEYNLSIK
jgi:hypothetical protein